MSDFENEINAQLTQVTDMLREQQQRLEVLTQVTESQTKITDAQSRMIDKMWNEIQPVLQQKKEYEARKKELIMQVMKGGVWAAVVGVSLLIWQGFKHYILNGGS